MAIARSLQKLLADNPDKVSSIWDERRERQGYWINLKPGWRASEFDYVHSVHEDTAREALKAFRWVVACDCPSCQGNPE